MSKSTVVSRTSAVNLVINSIEAGKEGIVTQDSLVQDVEAIVVQSGGKENREATLRALNKTVKCAVELGVLTVHCQVAVERVK